MSSLADLRDLAGFFSYSRRDDEDSDRSLSDLRRQIYRELRTQLGRELKLWQDTEAIPGGAEWEREIKHAISCSVFFIPIVTPSLVTSSYCRLEFDAFLAREGALGRDNLIFPLLYVRVPALESEELWRQDSILAVIGRRQYFDWKKFRHRSFTEAETKETIEQFCRDIVESLRQPWVSPTERRAEEDVEARRIKEQTRREQKEKRLRAKTESRQKAAEAERLAAEETEAQRMAEQARRDQEEKKRQQTAADPRQKTEHELRRLGQEAETRPLSNQERLRAVVDWQLQSIGMEGFGKEEPRTRQRTEAQPKKFQVTRASINVLLGGITLLGLLYFLLWPPAPADAPSAPASPPVVIAPSSPLALGNFLCVFYQLQNNADGNRVAILIDDDVEEKAGIQPAVQRRGFTIAALMIYPSATSDFAGYLSKATAVAADMIVHCGRSSYAFTSFLKRRGVVRQR
jgi:hypothetical protein